MDTVQRLRPRTVAALCVTEYCTLSALVIPLVVGLSLRVRELDSGLSLEARLSWVETTGALTAMCFNPVFGWLSDHTVRRRGHRATWIAGGAVAGCGAVIASTYAPNLPTLVVIWACAQLSYCAVFAALYGTLSDIVHPDDRARVSGWFAAAATGAISFGGLVAFALLTGRLGAALSSPRAAFLVLSLIAVPVALVASRHLRTLTPRPRTEHRGPVAAQAPARGLVAVSRSLGEAGSAYWWLWLQRFFAQGAYASLTIYGVFFLIRRTGEQAQDAAAVVALATAVGAALGMAMAAGGSRALARVLGYRPVMAAGILLLLGANVLLSVSTDRTAFVVALLCAGAGLGTYVSLDLAAALAVLPDRAGGRFLGYFNIARTLPPSLIGILGPALLAIGDGDLVGVDASRNYFAFFVFGSALAVVALVLLTRLTVPERTRAG